MFKVIFYFLLQMLFLVIPILVNVAFITLLERKILGLSQSRKGPNKVFLVGLFQPFSDAIKLFLKEFAFPYKSNFILFSLSPVLSLFLMLFIWATISYVQNVMILKYSVLFFLFILSFNIYPLFLSGWSSNSKYALIGSIRGISQTISYEISLALVMFSLAVSFKTFNFYFISFMNTVLGLFFNFFPIIIIWLISCVAETNRTPFDFSEGESELVSGFNVEYSSVGFALLFMAEYGMIMFLSALTVILSVFYGINFYLSLICQMILVFFWIWLRATFPRFRYDKLMNLGWKINLPLTLIFLIFFSIFSIY